MTFSFRNTIAFQTFCSFRQWKILLLMIFFDALFVLSLFAFAKLFDTVFELYERTLIGSWKGYALLLVYFCFIVIAYSFFKYCQFDFLEQQAGIQRKSKKTDFSMFRVFLLYNLMTLFVLVGGFIALSTFFAISLIPFLKKIGIILLFLIFMLFGYWFVQASHVIFWKKKELPLQQIPKNVLALFDWKQAGPWLGWNLAFFLFFFLCYLLLSAAVSLFAKNALVSAIYYYLFFGVNIIIVLFLFLISYFVILWNRIYLFFTISNALKQMKEKEIHKI